MWEVGRISSWLVIVSLSIIFVPCYVIDLHLLQKDQEAAMDDQQGPDWPYTEEEIEEYNRRLMEKELTECQTKQNERIAREERGEAATHDIDIVSWRVNGSPTKPCQCSHASRFPRSKKTTL